MKNNCARIRMSRTRAEGTPLVFRECKLSSINAGSSARFLLWLGTEQLRQVPNKFTDEHSGQHKPSQTRWISSDGRDKAPFATDSLMPSFELRLSVLEAALPLFLRTDSAQFVVIRLDKIQLSASTSSPSSAPTRR